MIRANTHRIPHPPFPTERLAAGLLVVLVGATVVGCGVVRADDARDDKAAEPAATSSEAPPEKPPQGMKEDEKAAFIAARQRGDLISMRAIVIAAIAGESGRATAIVKDVVNLAPDQAKEIVTRAMQTFPQLANRIKAAAAPPVKTAGDEAKPPAPQQTIVKEIEKSQEENPYGKLSGETTLGGSYTNSNQKTMNLNASFKLEHEIGKWKNSGSVAFDYGQTNKVTNTQSWDIEARTRRDLTERTYGYGQGEYEDNRFSGFDYQLTEGVGIGYRVIDKPALQVNLEGGPSMRHSKISATEEVETETLLRLAGLVDWDISDTATFSNETALLFTGSSFEVVSEGSGNVSRGSETTNTSTLDLQIISNLAARLSYEIHYRSEPPEGGPSTESTAKVSLVHNF